MAQRTEYKVDGLPQAISHYTDVVRFGDLVYLAGVGPGNQNGEIVCHGDVKGQTRQIFENLKLMLATVGGTIQDILKVTVFVANRDDREAIDVVRREYFGDAKPVSTLIEISRFCVDGTLLEIDAVAGLSSPSE